MKLLYVVEDRWPPFRADVVELFAHQLSSRGHEIHWVMRRSLDGEQPIERRLRWHGQPVDLPLRTRGSWRVLAEMWADIRLLRLAWRGRFDVIQVRDRYLVALWAWLAARLTGARFVFWMSYPFAESKLQQARQGYVRRRWAVALKGRLIAFVLYRLVLPLADHAFVQSERMKADVAAEGIDPRKMTVVPMGIRADQVLQPDDARAPDRERPLLLYLGILMRLRQTEMLVRVLARVRQRYPQTRLRFVGEGVTASDRQAILDEATRLGLLQAVELTGFVPMAEAWVHVREADICFSPFYPTPVLQSTSPTKLIEYMALAKCVVANDHPEQTQVLADAGMGPTVPWDEEAFAQAALALLDEPEAARARAARGPEWVRAHRTYDVIAEQVHLRYEALLGHAPLDLVRAADRR